MKHFKKYTETTWSVLLADKGYRHHFSECELYSIKRAEQK